MSLLNTRTDKVRKQLEQARKQIDHSRKQLDQLDLDKNLPNLGELRLPRYRDEPESSSGGFAAGVAVGLVLGVVLAWLFGKQGGGDMVDQFAQRAESLKETAAEKYHQARDQVDDQADRVEDTLGNGPVVEREVGDTVDELQNTTDDVLDDVERRRTNG